MIKMIPRTSKSNVEMSKFCTEKETTIKYKYSHLL